MKAAYLKLFLPAMALIERAPVLGAERLVGVESARVMSQSMPWIAAETGMFRKYNRSFRWSISGCLRPALLGRNGKDRLSRQIVGRSEMSFDGRSLTRTRFRSIPSNRPATSATARSFWVASLNRPAMKPATTTSRRTARYPEQEGTRLQRH